MNSAGSTHGDSQYHLANLQEAEDLFGIERFRKPKKRHKEQHYKETCLAHTDCAFCDKRGYDSEEAARIIIGRMLHNGSLSGPGVYTFRPYMCAQGYWHTGHSSKSRLLLTAKVAYDPLRETLQR
jgi:hypothetical protein